MEVGDLGIHLRAEGFLHAMWARLRRESRAMGTSQARGALGGGLTLGVPPRDDEEEEEGDKEEDRNRVGGSSEKNMSVAAALTVLANAQQTLHRALSRAHESARWARGSRAKHSCHHR